MMTLSSTYFASAKCLQQFHQVSEKRHLFTALIENDCLRVPSFCLLLTVCQIDSTTVEISQNFISCQYLKCRLKMLINLKRFAFVLFRASEDKYIKYYKSFTKHFLIYTHRTLYCYTCIHMEYNRKYIQWDMHTITALPYLSNLSALSGEVIPSAFCQKYKTGDPDRNYPYKKGD